MRRQFILISIGVLLTIGLIALVWQPILWLLVLAIPLIGIGVRDMLQTKRAILRNYPLVGHIRYLSERFRPEIRQYFIESDTEGVPFGRDERSIIYQRAKDVRDTVAFGTLQNVYATGYEWVNHSLMPAHVDPETLRVTIGGKDCKQPYSTSILNISAMSYGSLSSAAVLALNGGAKMGNFAHNTGEGGVSPYHLQEGGDLIWQIGTGYFGCRNADGDFDPPSFKETAAHPNIKMIEIKLSQGAKPGHGGILPASKLTPEIAEIRKVGLGKDVISPPAHTAFSTPIEMMAFIGQIRELSAGKPVGIKLCVGKRREVMALCKAMIETGIAPDYIAVDGAEGGTGAAPLEFSNHIGTPLIDGLILVHNALVGFNLRDQVKIIASGKVVSGFNLVKRLALGADVCASARAMMMAIGCIQARKCNTNHCPVGIATQKPYLVKGLDITDKRFRAYNYHRETVLAAAELIGAMGLHHTDELEPWHILRRVDPHTVEHYGEMYHYLNGGELVEAPYPETYDWVVRAASAEHFRSLLPEVPVDQLGIAAPTRAHPH